ncbi:MAG: hypothetical protein IPM77_02160 [Crocinitomicaceae bacterium]|nr:hypothetical protein [Crocinitomicaceae bacterium]
MKKVYLLGGIFFLGAATFAQQTSKSYNFHGAQLSKYNFESHEAQRPVTTTQNQDRVLNILWTEDFAGSTALTTGNGTYTVGGANGSYWTIGTAAHPLSSFGWTNAMNGRHLMWDSYNPNDSETNFATTAIAGYIETPVMDLSGQTNGAIVEFVTESMYCCNYQEKPWYLQVSENGGTTWSTDIVIDFGVDRNVPTEDIAHPMTYSVDISSYIATTPGNVKLRIKWQGTAADGNGQMNTHYFWMLDDISIYETPANEVQNQKMWLEDISAWFEYGEIPTSQAPTLTVQNLVKSMGSNSPTAFGLQVTVYDDAMTQIHQSTGGTLSNPPLTLGDIDTITFATTFDLATLATGTYYVRTVVDYTETDEVMENDTLWRSFDITDNTFSHFNFEIPTQETYQGGTAQEEHQVGASFLLYEDAELHGVDMYISDGTTTNPTDETAEIDFYIYEWDGSAYSWLGGPFVFTLEAGMIGQYNTFNFHLGEDGYTPLTLTAGAEYVAVLALEGGEVVYYGANSFDEDASSRVYFASDDTWYLAGDEPM